MIEKAAYFDAIVREARSALLSNMGAYGNTLNEPQKLALRTVITTMARYALDMASTEPPRLGIPLPVGGGKTQSAACFAYAVWRVQAPVSLVIACGRIDSLHAIYAELRKLGVDPDAIGVLHADTGHALTVTGGNDNRKIMLVTHARIQGGSQRLKEYAYYRGTLRDLVIYDESLITSDHWSVDVASLVASVGGHEALEKTLPGTVTGDLKDAFRYLSPIRDMVVADIAAQADGKEPSLISFPPLSDADRLRFISALPIQHSFLECVFKNAGGQARGLRVQGKGGIVWFSPTVPDELKRIIVLDASLIIRLLPQLNNQVIPSPRFNQFRADYSDVTLHHWDKASGRSSMAAILDDPTSARTFAAELGHVVNNHIPLSEAANIWTFKGRGDRDYKKQLSRALAQAGVDLGATVDTPNGRRDRINILTWGQETASNEYSYARHTLFAGVLHRDRLEMSAAVVAANRDLKSDRHLDRVSDLIVSEVVHSIYQAAGRSALRKLDGGKARAATIWLPLRNDEALSRLTSEAFPGIRTEIWQPRNRDWQSGNSRAAEFSRVIRDTLHGLPSDVDEISSRELYARIEEVNPSVPRHKKIKAAAENLLVRQPPDGWIKRARSWSRVSKPVFKD